MNPERKTEMRQTLDFLRQQRWPESLHTEMIGVLAHLLGEVLTEVEELNTAIQLLQSTNQQLQLKRVG